MGSGGHNHCTRFTVALRDLQDLYCEPTSSALCPGNERISEHNTLEDLQKNKTWQVWCENCDLVSVSYFTDQTEPASILRESQNQRVTGFAVRDRLCGT